VQRAIDAVHRTGAHVTSRIKRFRILPREFTLEDDEGDADVEAATKGDPRTFAADVDALSSKSRLT